VKLLVDMNLSPSWVERLGRHGFEAVHWSTIGAATAPDVKILAWATEHAFVLVTNDLGLLGNPRSQRRRHAECGADPHAGPALRQLR
jgi:predicted nuclease of predicted toxin-antitoxin system